MHTQLWVGWTPDAPQPVFRPFVLRLLRTAVLDPRIAVHMSAVPVGAELGLTAILAADTPPYCAWGAGLAEFGAQAAIEAQSPYYKLLIGRVLGYEMDNIRAHVEVCDGLPGCHSLCTTRQQQPTQGGGETLEPVTVAMVDSELERLSAAEPVLPWWHRHDPEAILKAGGTRRAGSKKKAAASTGEGEATKGFGGAGSGRGGKRARARKK